MSINCHLWNNHKLSKKDLYDSLEVIEIYDEDSHLTRSLKRCTKCGQLYFYEFKEFIDWDEGDDAQYQTYIPVDDKDESEILSEKSAISLLTYPSIRIDFPSDAKIPKGPYYFNVKDEKIVSKKAGESNDSNADIGV